MLARRSCFIRTDVHLHVAGSAERCLRPCAFAVARHDALQQCRQGAPAIIYLPCLRHPPWQGTANLSPSTQGRGRHARSPKAKDRNLRSAWELIIFGDGPKVCRLPGQTANMPEPEKDVERPDNVVSLGTEFMVAIAEELRRMYAAYLREKPPDRIARLMRQIERGEDISSDDVS